MSKLKLHSKYVIPSHFIVGLMQMQFLLLLNQLYRFYGIPSEAKHLEYILL